MSYDRLLSGVVYEMLGACVGLYFFFFQAEDGIRDLVRSHGLGDVYKRQGKNCRPVLLKDPYWQDQ